MRLFKTFCFYLLMTVGAMADCNPMPGLSFQQWVAVCGPELQRLYFLSGAPQQGIAFATYVQFNYGVYSQPAPMPMPMPGGNPMASGGVQMCTLGEQQCFSGWARSCQSMATGGTWWVTSAVRC